MVNQSVYAVFDDCRTFGDTKLFFHYDNAKKYFGTVVSENEPEGNVSLVRLTIEDAAGINEFDNPTDASDNYKKEQSIISGLSITDIVKASDYINELASFIPTNNEVLDYLEDIQRPLIDVIKKS